MHRRQQYLEISNAKIKVSFPIEPQINSVTVISVTYRTYFRLRLFGRLN